MTRPTLLILAYLLDRARCGGESTWGFDIASATGLKTGTVYPALSRLEEDGWVTSKWDDDPARPGPRRRLYRLTASGAAEASAVLAEAEDRLRAKELRWLPG